MDAVIPAKAGIHFDLLLTEQMDPGFRLDDERKQALNPFCLVRFA